MSSHWWSGGLDRRATARAEYRRTPPALLEFDGLRCAVRDLGVGGLRIEPAPPGRVWSLGIAVVGEIQLRGSGRLPISGRIMRIDRAGLAIQPDGAWPSQDLVNIERDLLMRGQPGTAGFSASSGSDNLRCYDSASRRERGRASLSSGTV